MDRSQHRCDRGGRVVITRKMVVDFGTTGTVAQRTGHATDLVEVTSDEASGFRA